MKQQRSKATVDWIHEQRAAGFADVLRPGERIMETSHAIMISGLGWRPIPRGRDPENDMLLTDERLLYRDCRGAVIFPWGHVDDWRVQLAKRARVHKGGARLDLWLHDGNEMRIRCDAPFAIVFSSLAAAYTRDMAPEDRPVLSRVVGAHREGAAVPPSLEELFGVRESG
jgi:hypothetical protein